MAKNRPVINWITRHKPKRDPKFHMVVILLGVGKSINAPLIIFIKLFVFILE